MIVDGEFKRCVQDNKIDELAEQKWELLPEEQILDVFDVDYEPPLEPDLTLVKSEPVETGNSLKVGHIINQPAGIARAIKQELIDSAVQSVVEHHSSECELREYVQSQGQAGLCIEVVQTLINADQLAQVQPTSQNMPQLDPIPVATTSTTTITTLITTSSQDELPVVTASTSKSDEYPETPRNIEQLEPLPVVTSKVSATQFTEGLEQ